MDIMPALLAISLSPFLSHHLFPASFSRQHLLVIPPSPAFSSLASLSLSPVVVTSYSLQQLLSPVPLLSRFHFDFRFTFARLGLAMSGSAGVVYTMRRSSSVISPAPDPRSVTVLRVFGLVGMSVSSRRNGCQSITG